MLREKLPSGLVIVTAVWVESLEEYSAIVAFPMGFRVVASCTCPVILLIELKSIAEHVRISAVDRNTAKNRVKMVNVFMWISFLKIVHCLL